MKKKVSAILLYQIKLYNEHLNILSDFKMNSRISRNYTARSTSKHVESGSKSKSTMRPVLAPVLTPVPQPTSDMIDSTVSKKSKKINYNKRELPNRERRTWVEERRQYDFSEPTEYYSVPNYQTLKLEHMLEVIDAKITELETLSCSCDFSYKESIPSPCYDSDDGVCYKHQSKYEYDLNKFGIFDALDYYIIQDPIQDTYSASEYNTKGAKRNSTTWRRTSTTKRMSRIDAKKTHSEQQYAQTAMDFYIV